MTTVSENAIIREMEVIDLRNEAEKLIKEHGVFGTNDYLSFDNPEATARFDYIQKQLKQLLQK